MGSGIAFIAGRVSKLRARARKGGHHKIYYPLMDEKGYVKYLIKTIVESMRRDSPEATREVLEAFT